MWINSHLIIFKSKLTIGIGEITTIKMYKVNFKISLDFIQILRSEEITKPFKTTGNSPQIGRRNR